MGKVREKATEPAIEPLSRNVLGVRFPYVHDGWEQYILLTSDRHHDSKWTDRELEIEHLEMAKKRNGVDLISNLTHRLNTSAGTHIQAGFYGGWVKFFFNIGTHRLSKNLKYFHGAGGGGPVTRGVIQTNRQAVYLPDADIVVNGHTHDAWHVPIQRERLSDRGLIYQDTQHHIRTTSYKDEYRDGGDGWHVETWKPPKPIGACWMRLFYEGVPRGERKQGNIKVEVTQALRQ